MTRATTRGDIAIRNGVIVGPPRRSVNASHDAQGSIHDLLGGIELRNLQGPAFVGTPYTVPGENIAVGQSPKTEYSWHETSLDDADGRRIAEMRMQLRWMKASSPLYQG